MKTMILAAALVAASAVAATAEVRAAMVPTAAVTAESVAVELMSYRTAAASDAELIARAVSAVAETDAEADAMTVYLMSFRSSADEFEVAKRAVAFK